MIDVMVMGEIIVEIMREREGVELFEQDVFRGPFPSGAPAICIDTVARLGCESVIIGGVGDDDFGKCVVDRLKKDGVDCSRVIKSKKKATGCAFVTYFKDGSRKFLYHMGNTPAVEAKAPKIEGFPKVRYMHIMGCSLMASKEFSSEIEKTMKMLVKNGTKISFDPNVRKELLKDESVNLVIQEVMKNTNIFLPGLKELLLITNEKTEDRAIEKCFKNPKMEIILLKNGSKGSTVYTRDWVEKIGIYEVDEIDPTGAGDCFDGAFLAGISKGKSIIEAAKMGAAAGALNASAFGPMEGKISLETVMNMIEK